MARSEQIFNLGLGLVLSLGITLYGYLAPGQSDFPVFWGAARHASPYISDVVPTSLKFLAGDFYKPFASSPVFLLLIYPFGHLPYLVASALFATISSLVLIAGTAQFSRWPVLALIAWPVLMSIILGQVNLICAGLLALGLSSTGRPAFAGIMLAVALWLKPQLAFLLPIGLLACRDYRMFATTGAFGLLLACLATVVFGPGIWMDWLKSLEIIAATNKTYGFGGFAAPDAFRPAVVIASLVILWVGFQQGEAKDRVIALVGASLLCSPYSHPTDITAMVPALVGPAIERRWSAIPALAIACSIVTSWVTLLLAILTMITAVLVPQLRRTQSGASRSSG